jgi:hypothetical protein
MVSDVGFESVAPVSAQGRCSVHGRPFSVKARDERSKLCHVPLAAAHIHVGILNEKKNLQPDRSHTTPRGARNSPGRHRRRSRLPSLCLPKPNGGRRPPPLPPTPPSPPPPPRIDQRSAAADLVMRTRGQTSREDKPAPGAPPVSLGAWSPPSGHPCSRHVYALSYCVFAEVSALFSCRRWSGGGGCGWRRQYSPESFARREREIHGRQGRKRRQLRCLDSRGLREKLALSIGLYTELVMF